MTNQQLWKSVLGHLEVSVSHGNFTTWFKNASIIEQQGQAVVISVPSQFIKTWITNKFHKQLLKVLKEISPDIKEIRYFVGKNEPVAPTQNQLTFNPAPKTETNDKPVQQPQANASPSMARPVQIGGLSTGNTFDTFVIGKHNELAHAAAQSVSKNPGGQYNPLFLYGGVGLGKTHLMQAVGNYLVGADPRTKVLYITSEKFTNDFVNAIYQKQMPQFRKHYRSVDVLLIDDVQFIAGKDGTQEEFFHTFNELRDKGKQIIMTADRLPKEIPAIEHRLVSRFEWGMMADIQTPDLETRVAILQTKASKRLVKVDSEVLYFIAQKIVSNIRELEGALNKLIVAHEMRNEEITVERAEKVLSDMMAGKKKVLTLKKIASQVAEFYNLTLEDLVRQSRRKDYVKARQISMYIAREELAASYPIIGDFFGGRDHTTVMHGVKKIEKRVKKENQFKQEVELLMDKLYTT